MLTEILCAQIRDRGPITFRDFMEAALYHPEHGYYAAGRARIGREGDFFTSVSVGPLFGRLLARQLAEMWTRLGEPADFTIVEQGAHRGDFQRDALAGLSEFAPACRAAATWVSWEVERRGSERGTGVSPVMPGSHGADSLPRDARPDLRGSADLPIPGFQGVHFSNELVDAFPVHRVRWTGTEWREIHVASDSDRFVFADAPISSDALREHLARLPQPLPAGFETEINLAALDWISDLAAKLQRGWVLLIDYGWPRADYYRPERNSGTLSAYARHRREPDPLARPGEIDLTAHVDFTSLAERAEECGMRVCGFTDQHHFMVGLSRLHFSDDAPPDAREMREFKTLMHPEMLGHSFHALCFSKGVAEDVPLAGFHFARDARASLGLLR